MNASTVLLPLARLEGVHLANLVDEFLSLLQADTNDDPAVARLAPDPYPDDADASQEFHEASEKMLLERRAADARLVRHALQSFTVDAESLNDDPDAALTPRDVVIAADELDAWLRTLTALRLVIASRLGITDETDSDPDDPRFGVYDWLGYRLDGLVEAAEAQQL
ncbi:DUF2017 family protein [Microbacterium sp. YY-01]|uniref:DUF2017 family protein n=1 Tax=Microbacterium sp. YY-01 TaxID=3421634 RepID=UPI003D17686B